MAKAKPAPQTEDVTLAYAENNPKQFCKLLLSSTVLADDLGYALSAAMSNSSTYINMALSLISHYDRGIRETAIQTLAHYMNMKKVRKAMEKAYKIEIISSLKEQIGHCLEEPKIDLN